MTATLCPATGPGPLQETSSSKKGAVQAESGLDPHELHLPSAEVKPPPMATTVPQHMGAEADREKWKTVHMILDPRRSGITASQTTAMLPASWLHIFPNYRPSQHDRGIAEQLRRPHPNLLREFVVADISQVASGPRLYLLTLRGFTRAKFGVRIASIANLAGLNS